MLLQQLPNFAVIFFCLFYCLRIFRWNCCRNALHYLNYIVIPNVVKVVYKITFCWWKNNFAEILNSKAGNKLNIKLCQQKFTLQWILFLYRMMMKMVQFIHRTTKTNGNKDDANAINYNARILIQSHVVIMFHVLYFPFLILFLRFSSIFKLHSFICFLFSFSLH